MYTHDHPMVKKNTEHRKKVREANPKSSWKDNLSKEQIQDLKDNAGYTD